MSAFGGSNITTNGLVLYLDAANPKSATGGTTWKDISANDIPVTIVNPGSATVTKGPYYFEFTPSSFNSTATHYRITDSRVADLTTNLTFETCVYCPRLPSGVPGYGGDGKAFGGIVAAVLGSAGNVPWSFGLIPNFSSTTSRVESAVNTGNGANWSTYSDNFVPISVISWSKWIYVTVVSNDTTKQQRIFVNGQLRYTHPYTGVPSNSGGLTIGGSDNTDTRLRRNHNGRVSFVRLYNRPLSDAEVFQNYNAMRGRFDYDQLVIDSSLVLWLDADNRISYPGTGTAITDLSGKNTTGTMLAGVTYNASGWFDFNHLSTEATGWNSYVNAGNPASLQLGSEITLETWINPDSVALEGNMVSKGSNDGYRYRIGSSGQLQFIVLGAANNISSAAGVVANGAWSHCVVTGNSTGLRAYVNGVLVASNSTAYYITPSQIAVGNFTIGMDLYTPGGQNLSAERFDGKIAVCRVYNRALSAPEVLQNYNVTRARFGL
jgi:hypothetical protein